MAGRWGVYDVPDARVARGPRLTIATRTKWGAKRLIRKYEDRHRRMGCWPECSTRWHYEARRFSPDAA